MLKKNPQRRNISGYDIIGDIAIIEVPKNLVRGEKKIAKAILGLHKNISTVLKKKGGHEGTFRQKMKFLLGKNRKETVHKEHNCLFKLDVEKVYFSPRLSNERKRIFSQVKKGEKVLVMFSGCGVYPITISKNSAAKEIYAIEINPAAHKYALENVRLNKAANVKCFRGDVRKVVPKLKQKLDRIAMPLPKGGESFLKTAFSAAKKGSVIHFYDFVEEKEGSETFQPAVDKIMKACKKAGKKSRILGWARCGQIGIRQYRVCVDFKVLN